MIFTQVARSETEFLDSRVPQITKKIRGTDRPRVRREETNEQNNDDRQEEEEEEEEGEREERKKKEMKAKRRRGKANLAI